MTLGQLNKIMTEHNIPEDATLMSDSGWECSATYMDGIYYNPTKNIVVFTQSASSHESYHHDSTWKLVYQRPEDWEEQLRLVKKGVYEMDEIVKK